MPSGEFFLGPPFPSAFCYSSHLLISMENLEEGLVYFRLVLEAILDLVDVIDGVIELDGLLADGGKLTGYGHRGGDAMRG